jgi:hypothetical protein
MELMNRAVIAIISDINDGHSELQLPDERLSKQNWKVACERAHP